MSRKIESTQWIDDDTLEIRFAPEDDIKIVLSSVDVDEGRAGAGVADITLEGADITTSTFSFSDDRFTINAGYDLALKDGIALSATDEPTVPLTITVTTAEGHSHSQKFLIEVDPAHLSPGIDPADAPDFTLPDANVFDAEPPVGTLIYAPDIDPTETVKQNLMYGEMGAVFSGGWDYEENMEIIEDDGRVFFRTHLGEGGYVGNDLTRGAGFDTRTMAVDHAFFEYELRFKLGFDFVKGGKLPGLMGGDSPSGGAIADNGFSARLMWRRDGQGEMYLYVVNKQSDSGASVGRGFFHFAPGIWHRMGQEIKLNTVNPDGTVHADGIARLWIDDEPVIEQRGIIFRTSEDIKIEGMMNTIFFGGGDDSWAATRDEYVDHCNFKIWEL